MNQLLKIELGVVRDPHQHSAIVYSHDVVSVNHSIQIFRQYILRLIDLELCNLSKVVE